MKYQTSKMTAVTFTRHNMNKVEVQWNLDGEHSCIMWVHPYGNTWLWSLSPMTLDNSDAHIDYSLAQLAPLMPSLSPESLGWFWFELKLRANVMAVPANGEKTVLHYDSILF